MSKTIKLTSGATEADINAALGQLTSGGTIILPKNETISITDGLKIDVGYRNVTIDLNGSTLKQSGDATVIEGFGAHTPTQSAVLHGNAAGQATITYDQASTLKPGDWVKVFSDDVLESDYSEGVAGAATRLGQSMKVLSVKGDTVVLDGELLNQQDYKTDVRVAQIVSGDLTIKNGTISGDQNHETWTQPLVAVRSAIEPKVDHVTVENGNSMGISIINSIDAQISNSAALHLKDNPSAGQLGYGVHSASSVGTTVTGFYAEDVRHATDDNSIDIQSGLQNPDVFGADIGLTVRDTVAYNTTAFAYSWHSEGRQSTLTNVMAFDSYGFLGARGVGNSLDGGYGSNFTFGVQLYEYGDGDGREIDINDLHLSGITSRGILITGNPVNNTISNSSFETAFSNSTDFGDAVKLINTIWKTGLSSGLVVQGTDAADVLLGSSGVDIIQGGSGSDYIWGDDGIDMLIGGGGRDSFAYHRVEDGGDIITDFRAGAGGDVLDLSVLAKHEGWTGNPIASGDVRLSSIGAGTLVEVHSSDGTWSTLATLLGVHRGDLTLSNLVVDLAPLPLSAEEANSPIWSPFPTAPVVSPPSSGPSEIPNMPGYLQMVGTDGNDVIISSDANTILVGGDGTDYLTAGSGADILYGGNGNDFMTGGAGDDLLDGEAGTDDMRGGSGNDIYVASPDDIITEYSNEGQDTVQTSSSSYTLGENLENLVYTGTGAFKGVGNGQDNVITGGSNDDYLDGGNGADTLIGGLGNDQYKIADWNDTIVEKYNGGNDIVRSYINTYKLGDNIESLIYSGVGDFIGTGNSLNNSIEGGAGRDVIDGSTGADAMIGGAGDDLYYVDNAGDTVVEWNNGGTDTIQTWLQDYTLPAHVEKLTFIGTGNFHGTGNYLANVITGASGDDLLDGGAGADSLIGGQGNDTYIVDDPADQIVEWSNEGIDTVETTLGYYALSNNVENVTYIGSSSFKADGNADANLIIGGSGDDILSGGGGADTLVGGAGDDTYIVSDWSDVISEYVQGGNDTVRVSISSYTLGNNLENLIYTGVGNFNGAGNALDNTIKGSAGNDTLDGKVGGDVMAGGTGDDIYYVDDVNDIVTEWNDQGTDLVRTTLNTYTLANHAENLTFIGTGDFSATGNGLANIITGGVNDDMIDGGGGADRLIGGKGDDTYFVENSGDTIQEWSGEGVDTVVTTLSAYTLGNAVENLSYAGTGLFSGVGNSLDNNITGGTRADMISGAAGNDTLTGGQGNDVLTGGVGNDTFVFQFGDGADTVTDFTTHSGKSAGDTIELHGTWLSSFEDVIANAIQVGDDTLVHLSGNDQLLLDDVNIASLTDRDFIFL